MLIFCGPLFLQSLPIEYSNMVTHSPPAVK